MELMWGEKEKEIATKVAAFHPFYLRFNASIFPIAFCSTKQTQKVEWVITWHIVFFTLSFRTGYYNT